MGSAAAILLAAGESSRMKEMKALLPWGDTDLLGYSIKTIIAAGFAPLVIVLGYQYALLEARIPQGVTTVVNHSHAAGKSSSIKIGIETLGSMRLTPSSILIASVDQPRSTELLQDLRKSMENTPEEVMVSSPILEGKVGHPILFNSSLIEELLSINEETQGIRAIVSRHQDNRILVPTTDTLALTNLNTISEYQNAHSLYKASS